MVYYAAQKRTSMAIKIAGLTLFGVMAASMLYKNGKAWESVQKKIEPTMQTSNANKQKANEIGKSKPAPETISATGDFRSQFLSNGAREW